MIHVIKAVLTFLKDWKATLEEIELAGNDLPGILRAREEVQTGVGMTPDELHAYCVPT